MQPKIFILFLIIFPTLALAASESNFYQKQIFSVSEHLKNDQLQRNQLEQALKLTETNYGEIVKKIQWLNRKLKDQQAGIGVLTDQGLHYKKLYETQSAILAEQLHLHYLLSHNAALQLVMQPQGSVDLSRYLTYLNAINRDRFALLENLKTTIGQINYIQTLSNQQALQLKQLEAEQRLEQIKMENMKQARQKILNALDSKIQTNRQQLDQLILNHRALQNVVFRLQRQYFTPGGNFADLKNKMIWPVTGKIIHYFGAPIAQGQLHWHAVVIAAKSGTPVYAVAPGKVLFAKWMVGYGLLVIVDHGDGYLTLYGRNSSLNVKAGDEIQAGQILAYVGHSGGYHHSSLYFSIRHNGKALDPMDWFVGQP